MTFFLIAIISALILLLIGIKSKSKELKGLALLALLLALIQFISLKFLELEKEPPYEDLGQELIGEELDAYEDFLSLDPLAFFESLSDPEIILYQEEKMLETLMQKDWFWENTRLIDEGGEGEFIYPSKSGVLGISFKEDGSFDLKTDCNASSGEYKIDAFKLEISNILSTEIYCEGSQEEFFKSLLLKADTIILTKEARLLLLAQQEGMISSFFGK